MLRFLTVLKSNKGFTAFVILFFLGIGIIVFSNSALIITLRSATLSVTSIPLRFLAWSLHMGSQNEEVKELRQLSLKLALENSYLNEIERENIRLRKLLQFKERSRYSFIPVEVIGRTPDVLNNSIIIQGGKNKGLHEDMPVVIAEGLIGKITTVSWNSSVVQLLLDQSARVSVTIQRSRELGILEWSRKNILKLKNIEKREDVIVGDVIITSGLGGVYPKGIQVGKVFSVNDTKPGLFKEVMVISHVDFSNLEELFVLIIKK